MLLEVAGGTVAAGAFTIAFGLARTTSITGGAKGDSLLGGLGGGASAHLLALVYGKMLVPKVKSNKPSLLYLLKESDRKSNVEIVGLAFVLGVCLGEKDRRRERKAESSYFRFLKAINN